MRFVGTLAGSGDVVANNLVLSTNVWVSKFLDPDHSTGTGAFGVQPGACVRIGQSCISIHNSVV